MLRQAVARVFPGWDLPRCAGVGQRRIDVHAVQRMDRHKLRLRPVSRGVRIALERQFGEPHRAVDAEGQAGFLELGPGQNAKRLAFLPSLVGQHPAHMVDVLVEEDPLARDLPDLHAPCADAFSCGEGRFRCHTCGNLLQAAGATWWLNHNRC